MKIVTFVFLFLAATFYCQAQTINLLKNPNAEQGEENWKSYPHSYIERESGNSVFVVRSGGSFIQYVDLPKGSTDKFLVFFGRATSDRAYPSGGWTGRPSLYAYLMRYWDGKGGIINGYLAGENLISKTEAANEWNYLWGIYQVPVGTTTVSYFLIQGANPALPGDGSTAKFDDLGLYLFDNEESAKSFVAAKAGKEIKTVQRRNKRLAPCKLTAKQAPKIFGLYLSMPLVNALKMFPGIEAQDAPVQTVPKIPNLKDLKNGMFYFDPRKFSENPEFANIETLSLHLRDGLISEIETETVQGGAGWKNADDFIKNYRRKMPLPPAETWEEVGGIKLKYSVCEDFEISFFAAPGNTGTGDQIRLNRLRY